MTETPAGYYLAEPVSTPIPVVATPPAPPPPNAGWATQSAFSDARRLPSDPERLAQLRALGVDLDRCRSSSVRDFLSGTTPAPSLGRLFDETVRLTIVVLHDEFDCAGETIAEVLLLSGVSTSEEEIAEVLRVAERKIALVRGPFEDWIVRSITRRQDSHGLTFVLELERARDAATRSVAVTWSSLKSEWTFASSCAKAGCQPILRQRFRDANFQRFRGFLIERADAADATSPVAVTRDGRRSQARASAQVSADAVLLDAIIALVARSNGCWEGPARDLWMTLTAWAAEQEAGIPLGWPTSPGLLRFALNRLDPQLLEAGVRWAAARARDPSRQVRYGLWQPGKETFVSPHVPERWGERTGKIWKGRRGWVAA
jgi:hypothetical protein